MATDILPLPLTEAEAAIWNPPKRIAIDEWMERYYCLSSKTSDVTGLYSFDYTPFFREPMQRLSDPPVEVGIESCTQAGKSTLMVGVFGYLVDQDPAPTLFTMPRQDDAERRVNARIKPMFEANPDLLEHVPGKDLRNINIGKETVFDTMIAYLAWSTSPAAMSDNPICNALTDEPGKFEIITKTGENPFDLIDKRMRTYWMRSRSFYTTSPQDAGDLSDKRFRAGTDERWHVPCPQCGQWHPIAATRDTFILEKTPDGRLFEPDAYKEGVADCWYQCPHCRGRWDEIMRAQAIGAGVWVPKTQKMDPDGTLHGAPPQTRHHTYRVNSMMIHPRFWRVRLEAKTFASAIHEKNAGSLAALRDYTRNQKAEPWKEEAKVVDAHTLTDKINDYPPGVVPNDVRVLVAGADFHKSEMGQVRVDYLVKGFGNDLRNYDILFGHAGSLEEMFRATTTQSFPWAEPTDAPELMITCGFVDSGYQPDDPDNEIIDEVYQFCRRYWRLRTWYPIRGGKPNQVEMFKISPLDRVVEARNKKYRRKYANQYRGMELITLAVVQLKDLVAAWAEAPMDAPASTSYHCEMPPEFFTQLTNEYKGKNDKGQWGWWPKEGHAASGSHAFDVSVYATAAGYFKKVNELWSEEELQKIQAAMDARGIGQDKIKKDKIVRKTNRAIRTRY